MRHAKIICTLGPSSSDPKTLRSLVKAGMNCARLNFSHGTHKQHEVMMREARKAARDVGRSLALLQDLQGPKIRTGLLKDGASIKLKKDEIFRITTKKIVGEPGLVSTSYEALPNDVSIGSKILIDDGKIVLQVDEKKSDEVVCRVVHGGILKEHKGINLPGIPVSAPTVSQKDIDDLKFGLLLGVEYVALSFVRWATDIETVRRQFGKLGRNVRLIAKIERPEAVQNLDAILDAADGVMVARGDLGIEMEPARVSILQKEIISAANAKKKLVITATQMLESMVENPNPTRAEVSDVSNAIYDGSDALMLSGETASGKYPIKAVKMMSDIIRHVEDDISSKFPSLETRQASLSADPSVALWQAACFASNAMRCPVLGVFTRSGRTAWNISMGRPFSRTVAFTPELDTYNSLSLAWGVHPVLIRFQKDPSKLYELGMGILKKRKFAKAGESVLMITGTRTSHGVSNSLRFDLIK